jgi:pyridinium-3,5-biscarboxylic acid mononucleotide synthase
MACSLMPAVQMGNFVNSHILFDHARTARIGLPEAVFCEGKPLEALHELLAQFGKGSGHPVLFTRLAQPIFAAIPEDIRSKYNYHALSRTAFGEKLPAKKKGHVAVISAGTADGFVTWEAARTLEYLGITHTVFEDCGIAGLWRLTARLEEINACDAVIVVAGLDAALASVMGGLTPKPLFGVPSSVGYGAAQGGRAALASMLSSCAPGVGIMNIDNGYGAACAAARVVNAL